jgi:hypothetical protein
MRQYQPALFAIDVLMISLSILIDVVIIESQEQELLLLSFILSN